MIQGAQSIKLQKVVLHYKYFTVVMQIFMITKKTLYMHEC